MSDYEDEEFDDYDDDGFEGEEEEEDDYDVLPKSKGGATPQLATPKEVASPSRGPQRTSYAGNARPPSAGPGGGGGILGNRGTTASVDIPSFAGLTDAQKRSAMKKLAGALKRFKQIKLQVVAMDDYPQLTSLSKYELYNMGRSCYAGLKVASSQTHADDKEEECQTEEISAGVYGCQVPEDRNTVFEGEHTLSARAPGGAGAAGGGAAGGKGPLAATPSTKAMMRITAMAPDQESKLLSFMRWAGPVMLAALGMNPTAKKLAINAWGNLESNSQGLSQGSAKLGLASEALLAQRPVTGLAFCAGPSPLLLAAYAPVGAQLGAAALLQDHSLGSKGLMCVWDLSSAARGPQLQGATPSAVLVSEGSPSCCCWAPAPSTSLVFAGMEEGGVCAWDLDEPEGRHPPEQVGDVTVFTRRPSYTTEYLADVATTAAPIVGIATTPRTESRSRPCQVISLNGWGVISVYTAVILAPAEKNAADADIGLRPGSRLKLVRTTQLTKLGMRTLRPLGPQRPPPEKGTPPTLDQQVPTYSLAVMPGSDMQLLAGSDGGKVLRGSLVGVPPAPKEYVPDDHKSDIANRPSAPPMPSMVTCLAASPFVPYAFASGHSNGTVAVHSLYGAAAAAVFPDVSRGKIIAVRWSPVRPAVLFALDSLCTVFTFDLIASKNAPVGMHNFMIHEKGKAVPSLPTYFDMGLVNTGAEAGAEAGAKGAPVFCVGYDDGLLDVNLLSAKQCSPGADEQKQLEELLAAAAEAEKKAEFRAKGKRSVGARRAAKPKPKPKPVEDADAVAE
ncbi:hypothetical protein HYH02_010395 [Chlamydomonas schloesseri]|uniref:Uncharacterized protein n=1 Tax=Chlamydomonas schloesseri TaxID=2026947 RepID=A0A835W4Q5_9CHLO|nr:hypothetical protein HYH02_010395 [Chlamydomonas schloesseri]|eukprot:KAG2440517.1 hypothetical protein HYH02_010395 [Chlamydomonas schloesseri]